jgi:hypothetical protein
MTRLLSVTLALTAFIATAHAEDGQRFQCQKNSDLRSVAVEYSGDASHQSCSVLYQKQASAPAKELWHYDAHPGQCAREAEKFLHKLEDMGLACARTTDTASR